MAFFRRKGHAMSVDWSPLVDLIRRTDNFLLMTHVRPDADGLGSQLALADALRHLGKTVRVVIPSKLPPRYAFLDPGRSVVEEFRAPGDAFRNVGAVIVMDTGTWNQLGDFGPFLRQLDVPKAVVDHHRTQDDLGAAVRVVDTTAEATGRLAYELIRALGAPISAAAANNLFMALALDTGWFRHPNTTAATFDLAAELVRLGANPSPLYEQLFECAPVARLRLAGVALERLQTRAGGLIAHTEVLLKDYAATGAVPGDTEELINYPRSVEGVEVALLFIEQFDGGTKVSFRARSKVDVSKLAERFGGGGHKLASGARAAGKLPAVREQVLQAVEAALRDAGCLPAGAV
jgi:phosphoesterase RecJ-like protein